VSEDRRGEDRVGASQGGEGIGRDNGPESLPQRALDVLVFAPVGLAATAIDEFPTLVAKGRDRLSVPLRSAHAIGRLTVALGNKQLNKQWQRHATDLAGWARGGAPGPHPPAFGTPAGAPSPSAPATTAAASTSGHLAASSAPPRPGARAPGARSDGAVPSRRASPGEGSRRPVVDLAIPGYDTLPASQVVRRLDGLGPRELEAVYRYESQGRGRRTILHRINQIRESDGGGRSGPDADPH
jgi:hypothetical protein